MSDTSPIPRDEFSARLRELQANPSAVIKTTQVELIDVYGNVVTWSVKTVRADGADTVFLQRNSSTGGERWVLPAEVTAAVFRQREAAVTVNRKRGAATGAATRKAAK